MCKYCDKYESNKPDYVCSKCFEQMIYKTDAMKIYGLESSELDDLPCISYKNPYSKYTMCYKYHVDTLYEALQKIIKSLHDERRKNKLLGKIKLINDQKESKEKLDDMKKSVINMTYSFLNKSDQKYVGFYDETIEDMADELTCFEFSVADIALNIYNKIEELIIVEKSKNDLRILEEKRRLKLHNYILYFCEKLEYYILATKNSAFIEFVEKGDIKDKKSIKTIVDNLETLVSKKRDIDKRTVIINKKLKDNNISHNDPRCRYFYNRYINGNLTLTWCENKIKQIIKCNNEKKLREKTLIKMVTEKFGSDYCNCIDIFEESTHFLNYGDLKNINNVFEKLCCFIETEQLRRTAMEIVKKYGCLYDSEMKKLVAKFMNKTVTIDTMEQKIKNRSSYQKELLLHKSSNYSNQNHYFMKNHPAGSAKLDKDFKQYVCNKLYDFFTDNTKTNIIFYDIDKENYFFLKNKCDLLNFEIKKMPDGSYNVTKK